LGGTTLAAGAGFPSILKAQAPITLNGAVQFNDDHVFNRALVKFEELTKQYYGKPINFILHKNSSLGLEKQYFEYMAQGKAVDYGIVSPAHMSTFSKAAPFIDAPFLFRDIDHWNKVLDADLLKPIADEINKKAEGIYAVIDLQATPAAVAELDRQLKLNESVLRTKVIRPDVR
jgi:TRAP-type C4-dicarboxylate transport system substrate-binding protein